MSRQLDRRKLNTILQCKDLDRLSFEQLSELVLEETEISEFVPDGTCRVDPRNGDRILYNTARSRRPHDRKTPSAAYGKQENSDCMICKGKTTGVIDVAELSEGFTFINKNLYPILYPQVTDADSDSVHPGSSGDGESGQVRIGSVPASGVHLLQWTSSVHDRDWHNLSRQDRVVVMERLAVLEGKLLSGVEKVPGYVSIIKNYGPLVGGSLDHGHQQIALSNVMPRRFQDNLHFEQQRGEPFTSFILRENPAELLIRDYGRAVLIVPYFMRRPYDLLLVVKDPEKHHLHELNRQEIQDIADGWHDGIRAIIRILEKMGRRTVFNVISNNGPARGVYFDFLPYIQETGGMEQLGLFVCEQDPGRAAADIREAVEEKFEET